MRRVLVAALAVVGLVVAALVVAQSVGLSPLSPPASTSRVYVAISRSDDETDAREIEVIDTASGERDLFAVNGHITALAVARDRRTLFVGTSDGHVLFLNASSGKVYRTIEMRRPVFHLLALSDASQLAIVTSGAFSLWDVGAFRELGSVLLDGSPIGKPAERAGQVLIPIAESSTLSNVLVVVTLDPLSSARQTVLRFGGRPPLGVPQVTVDVEGQLVYVSQYDALAGGVRVRIGAVGASIPRELVLAAATTSDGRPPRGLLDIQASISPGRGGAINVCIGNAELATRYRLARGAASAEKVGTECGQLLRGPDGTEYLAVRGKPRVAILDDTGKIARGLVLPGIAVLAAS